MDATRRNLLEAAGHQVFDNAGDAMALSDAEKQEMDLRIALSDAVRRRREKLQLSQKELATRLHSTPARIAKIEMGNWNVSLEEILRAYSVMGGRVALTELAPRKNGASATKTKRRSSARSKS